MNFYYVRKGLILNIDAIRFIKGGRVDFGETDIALSDKELGELNEYLKSETIESRVLQAETVDELESIPKVLSKFLPRIETSIDNIGEVAR